MTAKRIATPEQLRDEAADSDAVALTARILVNAVAEALALAENEPDTTPGITAVRAYLERKGAEFDDDVELYTDDARERRRLAEHVEHRPRAHTADGRPGYITAPRRLLP